MTDNDQPKPSENAASEAAKALSALGASKGGVARAKKLSPQRRREIGQAAIAARWEKAGKQAIPKATHSDKPIRFGETEIDCAVLEDGTRVLSERSMTGALGGKRGGSHWVRKRGGAEMPVYLSANNIKPFIPDDLAAALKQPILYIPKTGGGAAHGLKAELLPQICDVWLKARSEGKLRGRQNQMAARAEIVIRGLAHVGIIALVDEATGYQDARAKDALARILEEFIATELRGWASTFSVDYYKQLFRLRGWTFPAMPADKRKRINAPLLVGKITNDIIYDRLAPGVREELHRLTPRDEKGRLKHHLHRRLTEKKGHPKLLEHIASVVALMKASDDWKQFSRMLDRSLPRYGDTPYLPFTE